MPSKVLSEDRACEQCKDGQNAFRLHSSLKGTGRENHQGRTVMTWPRRTLAIFLLAQGSFFLETLEGKGLGLGVLLWSGRSSAGHGTHLP